MPLELRCTWVWPNSSQCGSGAQFSVTNKRGLSKRPCHKHLAATVKQIIAISNVKAVTVKALS